MSEASLVTRLEKYRYLMHVLFALIAGIVMIVGSTQIRDDNIFHELLDELGVAVIVAGVVTLMYETYAREVLTHETMEHILEAVIGDMFDTQLWKELRNQLLTKPAIRRAFSVRIRLSRDDSLPAHQAVLWVAVSYRLHALHPRTQHLRVYHYLDRFMRDDALKLPRFENVVIGDKVVTAAVREGVYDEHVSMGQWADGGVPILIERREIVYTPGAYNLLMSDLTALETVQVEETPAGVEVEVNWTLDDAHKIGPYEARSVNRMLLPGHSIEFRFHAVAEAAPAPPPSSGTATSAA